MGIREAGNKFLTPGVPWRRANPEPGPGTGAAERGYGSGLEPDWIENEGERGDWSKKMAQGGVIGGTHLPWAEATAPITVNLPVTGPDVGSVEQNYDAGSMLGIAP